MWVSVVSCANAVNLTFSGTLDSAVEDQGPFSFPGWLYDLNQRSNPSTYPQAIYSNAGNTAVINVNNANGIALCKTAASGYGGPITVTFQGSILGGGIVTKTQALPEWKDYADVTFDLTWQPLSAITITTIDVLPAEIWDISYLLL